MLERSYGWKKRIRSHLEANIRGEEYQAAQRGRCNVSEVEDETALLVQLAASHIAVVSCYDGFVGSGNDLNLH